MSGKQPPWFVGYGLTRTAIALGLSIEDEQGAYCDDQDTLFQHLSVLGAPKTWSECEKRRRLFWTIFVFDRFCSTVTGKNFSLSSADVQRRLPNKESYWNDNVCPSIPTPYFRVTDANSRGSTPRLEIGHQTSVGSFAYEIEAAQNLSLVVMFLVQWPLSVEAPQDSQSWQRQFEDLDLQLIRYV